MAASDTSQEDRHNLLDPIFDRLVGPWRKRIDNAGCGVVVYRADQEIGQHAGIAWTERALIHSKLKISGDLVEKLAAQAFEKHRREFMAFQRTEFQQPDEARVLPIEVEYKQNYTPEVFRVITASCEAGQLPADLVQINVAGSDRVNDRVVKIPF